MRMRDYETELFNQWKAETNQTPVPPDEEKCADHGQQCWGCLCRLHTAQYRTLQ